MGVGELIVGLFVIIALIVITVIILLIVELSRPVTSTTSVADPTLLGNCATIPCSGILVCDGTQRFTCKLPAGQACDEAADCITGTFCSGLCVSGAFGPLNAFCPCNDGYTCEQTNSNGLTTCKAAIGTICTVDADCVTSTPPNTSQCVAGLCSVIPPPPPPPPIPPPAPQIIAGVHTSDSDPVPLTVASGDLIPFDVATCSLFQVRGDPNDDDRDYLYLSDCSNVPTCGQAGTYYRATANAKNTETPFISPFMLGNDRPGGDDDTIPTDYESVCGASSGNLCAYHDKTKNLYLINSLTTSGCNTTQYTVLQVPH